MATGNILILEQILLNIHSWLPDCEH